MLEARALYLFPTKALAQDQLKGLLDLVGGDAGAGRQPSGRACTTATRRPPSGGEFRARPISCFRIPTCCMPRCCLTIRSGRRCSRICGLSSSMRFIRIAGF